MTETDPPTRDHVNRPGAPRLPTVGMVALGVALLLSLMALTILRDDPAADPHSSAYSSTGSGPPVATTAATPDDREAPATAPAPTPWERARLEQGYLVVEASVDPVVVYERPSADSLPLHTLPRYGYLDVQTTLWAIEETLDAAAHRWYRVYLPVRPNGSWGWVREEDVSTKVLTHDVRIDLSEHRLDLYDRGQWVRSYDIGVGRGETPTPAGEWFVTIKMKTPDPNQVYGVLIMGLSAFSEELTDWPGGGQVGIHGTDDPATIGTDVSHGCIRLRNEDILELSNDVHLGTPVFIQE